MNLSQSNHQFGNTRWILLAALVGLIIVATVIIVQSMPSKAVRKKQEALLAGIEKRSAGRLQRLISENYADRWKFDRQDIVDTMLDGGSQFLVMVVKGEEISFEKEGDLIKVTMDLTVSGKPVGPGGQAVVRKINQLQSPFVFSWKKESFLPSSWRLVSLENESIPDEVYGYEPGDIRRRMQGN